MKLYTYFRSSSSFRVRIALNFKRLDWTPEYVHLVKGEQKSDDHLARNPQGLVPVLDDGGELITQSHAIMEYLEETHPEPALLPSNPIDRAHVRAMVNLVASEMQPKNNLAVLKYIKDPLGHDQETVDTWYKHWMVKGFMALEELVKRHGGEDGYCYGNMVTMADMFLVPQIWNARRFKVDMSAFPNLSRVEAKLYLLDAFKSARPENQPDAF